MAIDSIESAESGRQDSNLRPHGPKPCVLAKLNYAPKTMAIYFTMGKKEKGLRDTMF